MMAIGYGRCRSCMDFDSLTGKSGICERTGIRHGGDFTCPACRTGVRNVVHESAALLVVIEDSGHTWARLCDSKQIAEATIDEHDLNKRGNKALVLPYSGHGEGVTANEFYFGG